MGANFSHDEFELPRTTVLRVTEKISEAFIAAINEDGDSEKTAAGSTKCQEAKPSLISDALLSA
jgi:hypothetical protein